MASSLCHSLVLYIFIDKLNISMTLKRITFIVSIIAFSYFSFLLIMFQSGTEFPVIAGAIHEFIMLPLMLATAVFFIIALVKVIRERFNIRSTSFYSLLIFLAAIVIFALLISGYAAIESDLDIK